MIELESLTVENFGPFFGKHSLDFNGKHGVYVIYANNEHGKTTLLNAFRWAFTGQAQGKVGTIGNHKLVNRDAIRNSSNSTVTTQVTVQFSLDGTPYEVRRKLSRPPTGAPKMKLHLVEDGTVLSQEDAPKRLNLIIPPEMQQFFFFDAELISQFEFLLDHKAAAASQLKDAIELVLGIPVLRGCTETLRRILQKTVKDQTRREARTEKEKEISKGIGKLQKTKATLQEGIETAKGEIRDANTEMGRLESRLKENELTQKLLTRRTALEGELKGLKARAVLALDGLKDAGADGWRALLHDVMVDKIADLNRQEAKTSKELNKLRRTDLITELRREADKTGKCPICKKDHQHSNSKQGQNQVDESETTHLEEELQRIRDGARVFASLGSGPARRTLSRAVTANTDALDELSITESGISGLEEELSGVDEADVRAVTEQYSNQRIILNHSTTLKKDLEDKLVEAQSQIDRMTTKLIAIGSAQELGLKTRINLLNDLVAFFDQTADDYREDQKARIEKEASRIFLTTAKHVKGRKGLQITENYGLEVIQEDGAVEDLRSAGIEHIIAVSLIGALQATSPVRGPVVMDSPFGRLDITHGNRVMNLLPELAPQVLLLATDRELAEGEASSVLDPSQIIAERKLTKIGPNQTVIEPLGGGAQ